MVTKNKRMLKKHVNKTQPKRPKEHAKQESLRVRKGVKLRGYLRPFIYEIKVSCDDIKLCLFSSWNMVYIYELI